LALLQAKANSDLRSDDFRDKAVIYAQSPYLLTKQIAESEEWTAETIDQRQKVLAALGVKAWPF
ncbi:MAG: HNH endonuclease family protein, partial [Gemmatimonadaceae bacterium]